MTRSIALPSTTLVTPSTRRAWLGLALWLVVALTIALSGVLTIERRPVIPILLVSLLVSQIALYRRGGAWRALADSIEDRALVLFHVVRAPIGLTFLFLMAHGLDATFARVAGTGDVACGVLALVVGLVAPRSRRALLAWNLFGFIDIVVAVVTAQRILLFSDHPQTMGLLVHFPGMLLPTFLVPLIMGIHLLLFARLRRGARSESV